MEPSQSRWNEGKNGKTVVVEIFPCFISEGGCVPEVVVLRSEEARIKGEDIGVTMLI